MQSYLKHSKHQYKVVFFAKYWRERLSSSTGVMLWNTSVILEYNYCVFTGRLTYSKPRIHPHKEKSSQVRSGVRNGHSVDPSRTIQRFSNSVLMKLLTNCVLYDGAPTTIVIL